MRVWGTARRACIGLGMLVGAVACGGEPAEAPVPAPAPEPKTAMVDAGMSVPEKEAENKPPAKPVVKDAPQVPDADRLFAKARDTESLSFEHSLALCELRFREKKRYRDAAEEAAHILVGLTTAGLSWGLENLDEPDWFGVDLLVHMRFGKGPIYRARGAYIDRRTRISIPIASLRVGDPVWLRLSDEDSLSADDILAEWNFRFEGGSHLMARHGRASIECKLMATKDVEDRVGKKVAEAEKLVAGLTARSPALVARVEKAKRPEALADKGFDRDAVAAQRTLQIARLSTVDPTVWPGLQTAERALTNALRPVVFCSVVMEWAEWEPKEWAS